MGEKKEKLIVRGNEFYEIDMECMKRRQEGKECQNRPNESEAEKRISTGGNFPVS